VLRATGHLGPLKRSAKGIEKRQCWISVLAVHEADIGQLPPGMLDKKESGGKLKGTYTLLKGIAYYECAGVPVSQQAGLMCVCMLRLPLVDRERKLYLAADCKAR
jgi:hypothetical protein